MNASFNLPFLLNGIFQADQGNGVTPWLWVLIILVVVILLLWYLGRQERTDSTSRTGSPVARTTMAEPGAEVPAAVTPVVASVMTAQSTAAVVEAPVVDAEAVQDAAEETGTAPADYAPIEAPPVVAVESPAEGAPLPEDESVVAGGAIESQTRQPAALEDLTLIEGIGPKIASVLREAGIDTFIQLAEATPEELQRILLNAGLRLANPATWPEQARLAAGGNWDEFHALTASLRGGRRVD